MRRLFGADSLRSNNRFSLDMAPHCGARDFLGRGWRAAKSSGRQRARRRACHASTSGQYHRRTPFDRGPAEVKTGAGKAESEAIQVYTVGRAHPNRSAMWMADTR